MSRALTPESQAVIVAALAGRRIDTPRSHPPRFPLERVPRVRQRVQELFQSERIDTLVCAAACGADLIALDVAGRLGLRRHVLLPWPRARFRDVSVVDRPGDWGPLFDRIYDEVAAAGNLVELSLDEGPHRQSTALETANRAMLDTAVRLSRSSHHQPGAPAGRAPMAIVVWEGQSRGKGDLTAHFRAEAMARNFTIKEVLTA